MTGDNTGKKDEFEACRADADNIFAEELASSETLQKALINVDKRIDASDYCEGFEVKFACVVETVTDASVDGLSCRASVTPEKKEPKPSYSIRL